MAKPSTLRVLKFGGAALRDGPAFAHAASIVADSLGQRVVVASAMEGVTNRLAAAAQRLQEDESHIAHVLAELSGQHRVALQHVAPADDGAVAAIEATLLRLERLLYGMASTGENSARLGDLLQSFGERLAAPILAAALNQRGVRAQAVEAEVAGIRSRGPHGMANPDPEALRRDCRAALKPLIAAGIVPVVTGYYGVDENGHATLFGRGGSDYVAALVAGALDADVLELWKEVPGFMSADPNLVPEAHRLEHLGYDEAAELSQFGARILHPRSVEPLQERGIPIRIRNVADTQHIGTTITRNPEASGLRGVACMDGVALLRLRGPGLAAQPGVASRVFQALADTNVIAVANSQTTLTLAVADQDAARAHRALVGLDGTIQSVECTAGHSLVCIVGSGLSQVPGTAARILAAVAVAGVNVEMISLAGNDVAFGIVVRSTQAVAAVRAIHGHLEPATHRALVVPA